jgi:hypothetical protein
MPDRSAFEYAVLRLVPDIERGEAVNVGVVLFCRTKRFLDAQSVAELRWIEPLWPHLDQHPILRQIEQIGLICRGDRSTGLIGELPAPERFRWVIAPRSTILQAGPVHCGLCSDPAAQLQHLYQRLVGRDG